MFEEGQRLRKSRGIIGLFSSFVIRRLTGLVNSGTMANGTRYARQFRLCDSNVLIGHLQDHRTILCRPELTRTG